MVVSFFLLTTPYNGTYGNLRSMSVPSEITGIHQADVLIRSALIAAIEDMRANDWLLDHAFNWLPSDLLTKADYGRAEVDKAKRWFRSTKIPVLMSTAIVDPSFPCITITLVESGEAETTLSDTHYVPQQEDDRLWPALTPVFVGSWGPTTGLLVVPDRITEQLVLAPGMMVIDRSGRSHPILEVVDDSTVRLAPEAAGDFTASVIKGARPTGITTIGSVAMKEVYAIGCHVQGEQVHLTYLHTLLVFMLYRYKASLLEARGFERTVVSSSDFRHNEAFEMELTFSRHTNITGYVRQVWPEYSGQKIQSIDTRPIIVCGAGTQENPEDLSWIGEEDALTVALRLKR